MAYDPRSGRGYEPEGRSWSAWRFLGALVLVAAGIFCVVALDVAAAYAPSPFRWTAPIRYVTQLSFTQ